MNVMDRARQIITGARAYRFEGEKEIHARQLRETQTALSMMANADPNDPDQVRMATDFEHGGEARLTVLLNMPRLTLAEKRERDDIQRGISARRQGLAGNVLVPREDAPTDPKRFLSALGGIQLWQALAVGWAVTFGLLGVQTALKERIENQRDEARANLAMAERHLEATRIERDLLAEAAVAADQNSQQTARNIEAERRLRNRAEAELRRARRAIEQAGSDGPIDYGFGGVRNDQPPPAGTPSGTGSGTGNPS